LEQRHNCHAKDWQEVTKGTKYVVSEAKEYKRGKDYCTVDLLFDWFGLVVLQIKTNIVSCHAADSKPVKKEVNGTVIIPSLVFPCEAEATLTCLLKPV
jgi:hypothetical protein